MNRARIQSNNSESRDAAFLFPLVIIGAIITVGILSLIYLTDDTINPFSDMYLMPWVFLLGATIAVPNVYLIYKKRFHLFHPICFAAWSYFIPGFFIGGLLLASNLSQPFYLTYVEDEHYNLPLTLVYITVGYAGLSFGFFLPYAKSAGEKIKKILPVWDWQTDKLFLPGLVLLAIGWINNIIAFSFGILGYQKVEQLGQYDGLLFLLTLLWIQGSFVLWMCIFRTKHLNFNHYLILTLLLATSLAKAAFQGNRGSLVTIFFLISCAFVFSVKRLEFRHRVYGGVLLILALVGGMIYGTTFRRIKGTEAQVSTDEYVGNILTTFDKLGDQDLTQNLSEGFAALAERIEAVSSLAVVVANYEKLEPYEESYGLKDNIWNDSLYFFIPRPLWKDKPIGSSPRDFSDLYFNFGENSFIITPMGDLLRNFGPIGILLGMMLLGFVLSIIYSALIENQEFSYWRITLYYVLLTSVSYEGFYGTLFPNMIRYGVLAVAGLLLINFFAKQKYKT